MTKNKSRTALGLLTAALALFMATAQARAAGSANLDLQVAFSGQLSVSIDGIQGSTRAVSGGPNTKQMPSSATVTNDSTGFVEQWQLSVASTGNWAVNGTTLAAPSSDEYAYQALFISSAATAVCPAVGASPWDQYVSTVTGTPIAYRSAMYSDASAFAMGGSGLPDTSAGAQNGNMNVLDSTKPGAGKRGLCVRVYMPSSVTTQTTQLIRLTITAANAL